MKKAELEVLVQYIFDIADRKTDPYEEDDMRIMRIRDLCAQALGRDELIPGAFMMPTTKEDKKR